MSRFSPKWLIDLSSNPYVAKQSKDFVIHHVI